MTRLKFVSAKVQRMKKADKLVIFICTALIIAVLSLLGFYFNQKSSAETHKGSLNNPNPSLSVAPDKVVQGSPVLLSLPSLDKTLNVIPGSADKNGNWTLTYDKVQYATISPEPNNKEGNTLIYGHETKNIFTYLYRLKKGDIASVKTSNGYVFHYKYEGTYAVNPHDLSVFDYKGAPILTLQTCSGAFFQNRQMYQFAYIGYDKA